jgi:hypothetical protein
MRRLAVVTGVLTLLAVIGVVLAVLALEDIAQGEADVSLEWWMVRVTFIILVVFITCSALLVSRVLRQTQ